MQVLFVAAEAAPFAKVGGLGDVAGALPPALARLGQDARVILPRYAGIDPIRHGLRRLPVQVTVRGPEDTLLSCGVWEGRLQTVPVYLVEEPLFLGRDSVYGYADDLDRFAVFCRAVLALGAPLELRPDVLHCNDWHTALLPAWLALGHADGARFDRTASVLTIHNLAFQGHFDDLARQRLGLAPASVVAMRPAGVPLGSALALGLRFADVITAVSPAYAEEVQTLELGAGLDSLLRSRRDRLVGILNGIDFEAFDPARDPAITPNYDLTTLDRKAQVKAALQRELALPERSDLPLLGLVGRLTDQKGFDLALPALAELLGEQALQIVVLGTGEPELERQFAGFAAEHPSSVAVALRFDAALAQRIYAGADLFLMPSRFEPCGLGQLIALRYGTVPVVRATGGLRDTVEPWDPVSHRGNGFRFDHTTPGALLIALARALEVFRDPAVWRRLQGNGMREDHSWAASAGRYLDQYHRAVAFHHQGGAEELPGVDGGAFASG
jgi:starch synthase